jgi:hypothetical protein
MKSFWIPAFAGMTAKGRKRTRVRVLPVRRDGRLLDSRLRGNDGDGSVPDALGYLRVRIGGAFRPLVELPLSRSVDD